METSGLISVIVPAYNSEKFIENTIKSISEQSYCKIEIIIINDGSTDGTEAAVKQLQVTDNRIRLISQANQGIAASRNTGIKQASGEFIMFIDSDDDIAADYLLKMMNRQRQTQGNIIYSGYLCVTPKGTFPKVSDFRENNNLLGYLEQKSLAHIGCFLLKKEFLLQHGLFFDEHLRTGEDILFICSLYTKSTAYAVPEYIYHYQYRTDSIMNSQWTRQDYEKDIQAWQNIHQYLTENYDQHNRAELLTLLESKLLYYKLRYLWLLLLSRQHYAVRESLTNGFLNDPSPDLIKMLPKKYALRKKIIESKNRLLWKTLALLPSKGFRRRQLR